MQVLEIVAVPMIFFTDFSKNTIMTLSIEQTRHENTSKNPCIGGVIADSDWGEIIIMTVKMVLPTFRVFMCK